MADTKISALVDGGAPQATDEFVVARGGDNFKLDFASLDQATLDQAVILAPASSARNVIQPTAGAVIAAIWKAHAAQSVSLMQWQTSAGVVLMTIGPTGCVTIEPSSLNQDALWVKIPNTGERRLASFERADALYSIELSTGGINVFGDGVGGSALLSITGPTQTDILRVEEQAGKGVLSVNGSATINPSAAALPFQVLAPVAETRLAQFWDSTVSFGLDLDTGGIQLFGDGSRAVLSVNGPTQADIFRVEEVGSTGLIGVFNTTPVGQQAASTVSGLWTALKNYGWLTSGSTAPAVGAPSDATYIVQTASAGLSAEQALGALATGIVKNTTTTGVLSIAAQGTDYYAPGGTDVAVADGGTGASTAATGLANLGGVAKSLYDANTVLAADTDDTPAAVTMGASTILARLAAGNIKAASVAEIITLLQAYTVGGTDVAVTDGGTGASTAAGARTALDVPSNAEAILDAIIDAKGDLLVGTAADTVARQAVGADGMRLVADTNSAGGMMWTGGYPWINSYVSGRYYAGPYIDVGNGDPSFTNGRMLTSAFPVYRRTAFDRIGFWLVANYGASTVIRLGIYNATTGMTCGTLIVDAGTVTVDAGAGSQKEATIAVTLDPGLYFLVAAYQGGGSAGSGSVHRVQQGPFGTTGSTASSSRQDGSHGFYAGITGAFADNPTVTRSDLNTFLIKLRAT